MKKQFFCILACLILFPLWGMAKDFVVVIDPGHGGKDPGATGKLGKEKNINLDVALMVGDLIKSNHKNVKVVYTRTTDTYVTLQSRPTLANKCNGDLYISIHTNASESANAYGAETFTLGLSKSKQNFEVAKRENSVLLLEENNKEIYQGFDPTSPDSYIMFEFMQSKYIDQSVEIASYIQSEFTSIKRLDRGVRQDIFWVLHQVKMPSILVELGFITNPKEESFLLSKDGQKELSQCIYKGFCRYKHEYDKRTIGALKGQQQSQEPIINDSNKAIATPVEPTETVVTVPNLPVKEEKPIKESNKNSNTTTTARSGVVYKLQVFSSKVEVPKDNRDYRKLKSMNFHIDYFIENGWYKYTCGNTATYSEALKIKEQLTASFPDAFIVAFRNNKRISLQEAKKESK